MKPSLQRSELFWRDLVEQVDWYRDQATPNVAIRFVDAVESTLRQLRERPGTGRPRFQDWPELAGIRSRQVEKPFHRFLIFYRFDDATLYAERLIYGGRDLPRRLLESPLAEEP